MKVGDLVRTIDSWSYKVWTGVIIAMKICKESEASENWAKVLWTEASQIDGQVFWAPADKLELVNESR